MEQCYQVINQTEHPILIRIRRADKARANITLNDILINREIIRPNQPFILPNRLIHQWVMYGVPLGIRIDHAGTSLNGNTTDIDHTPLIGGFQFSSDILLRYPLIIVHYNQIGKIDIGFGENNQEDAVPESDNQ